MGREMVDLCSAEILSKDSRAVEIEALSMKTDIIRFVDLPSRYMINAV